MTLFQHKKRRYGGRPRGQAKNGQRPVRLVKRREGVHTEFPVPYRTLALRLERSLRSSGVHQEPFINFATMANWSFIGSATSGSFGQRMWMTIGRATSLPCNRKTPREVIKRAQGKSAKLLRFR